MVRNLNFEVSDGVQDKNAVEKQFFAESNFRFFSVMTLGIENLRQRLSMMFFGQIKAELFQLIEDIELGILNCHQKLKKLRSARTTFDEQKDFFVDLNDDFQKLCEIAIKGDYEHDFFANRSLLERRLSAMIVNMRMDFEEKIRTEKAQWKIVKSTNDKKNCRTRTQAVKEMRKLLKMNRGREVEIFYLILMPALNRCLINYRTFRIHC